ncbi:MAG: hypothetical protein R3D55_02075 [Chloroflexota bacterium]
MACFGDWRELFAVCGGYLLDLADLEGRVGYGRIILLLNFVWVVGSYGVLLLTWSQLTVAGRWFALRCKPK